MSSLLGLDPEWGRTEMVQGQWGAYCTAGPDWLEETGKVTEVLKRSVRIRRGKQSTEGPGNRPC